MDFDLLFGLILTVSALGAVVGLTLWSRNIIERIHSGSPPSLRKIQNEIINGKKAITAETALQLEEAIPEIPAKFWLNLETDYQLTKALINKRSK